MLLLLSIALIFLPKVSPQKCSFFPKFSPENLPKCFRCLAWFIYITKMTVNMYLSKDSWNTHFCSPNTHQDGSPWVSHVSYCSLWDLKRNSCYSRSGLRGVGLYNLPSQALNMDEWNKEAEITICVSISRKTYRFL